MRLADGQVYEGLLAGGQACAVRRRARGARGRNGAGRAGSARANTGPGRRRGPAGSAPRRGRGRRAGRPGRRRRGSRAARASATRSGGQAPAPTRSSVPTMLRTWLCRKDRARSRKRYSRPAGTGTLVDLQGVEGADRALRLADRRAEGGEVVAPDQRRRAARIARGRAGGRPARRGRGRATSGARRATRRKQVVAAPRRRSGRGSPSATRAAAVDRHRVGPQMGVERRARAASGSQARREVEMRDLPDGMDAGVGAAGARDRRRRRARSAPTAASSAPCTLGCAGLPLPAGEGPAVVFDPEGVARHGRERPSAGRPRACTSPPAVAGVRRERLGLGTAAARRTAPLDLDRLTRPLTRGVEETIGRPAAAVRAGGPARGHRAQPRRQDRVHHLAGGEPARARADAAAAGRGGGADPRGLPAAAARPHHAALRLRGPSRRADRAGAALAGEHPLDLDAAAVAAASPPAGFCRA